LEIPREFFLILNCQERASCAYPARVAPEPRGARQGPPTGWPPRPRVQKRLAGSRPARCHGRPRVGL